MRLLIKSVVKNRSVLAGAELGRRLFADLVAVAVDVSEPVPLFLDFSGITVVTSSFFRESVVAFRDYARKTSSNFYPVVADANEAVIEEAAFFLRIRQDAFLACNLDRSGSPIGVRLIGELDDVQRRTFDRVQKLKIVTAPMLASEHGEEENLVGPTAWNNRLANLASRSLLIERRSGKTKTFAPVLEVM
jgi:hypothetical protein